MVGRDGRTRVMDLGLARGAAQPSDDGDAPAAPVTSSVRDLRVTQAGALIGTPAYMSPEHFAGREPDVRSDIFAFCVTLYEALHGERPFAGESLVALAANVLAGTMSPAPRRGRKVPRWLRRVYTRGLAVDPDQRYASMTALLAAIEAGRGRARRQRWGAAALGVAALVGGAVGLDRLDMSQKTAACAAQGAAIDEVWDDAARERLRAGLLATGAPFAAESLELFLPWLDAYREAWRAGRSEACAHATIARDWDADLLGRASWCFEDRRLQLEATVEQIATLTRASARRAVRIASYLDPVATCLDPALLLRLPTPPLEMRAEIRAIRALLSDSDRLRYAGRYAEALRVAVDARARAEALGWSPQLALARFIEGRSAYEAGQPRVAEEALLRAYFDALHDGSIEVAFRAARSLIIVHIDLQRFREAAVWARHADALTASLSDPGGLDAAEGHYLMSSVHAGLGDYDAAAADGERALTIRRDALGPDHPITAASYRNVGLVYLAQGRDHEALDHLERANAIWEAAVGLEHPYIAQLATFRGQALWALGRGDEALALLRRGVALAADQPKALLGRDALARALIALARVDEAEALIVESLDLARAQRGPRHRDFADALLTMAELDRARGRGALALARGAEALALLELAPGPEHPDVASAMERVAAIEADLGRTDAAIARRREALARREASLGPHHGQLAAPLVALGDLLLAAGHPGDARAAYARAHAIGERVLGPAHPALIPSLVGLARVALEQGRPGEAQPLAQRAAHLADSTPAGPRRAAAAHFALAQALTGPAEPPPQARALAEQALRETTTTLDDRRRAEVERWLNARTPPP